MGSPGENDAKILCITIPQRAIHCDVILFTAAHEGLCIGGNRDRDYDLIYYDVLQYCNRGIILGFRFIA